MASIPAGTPAFLSPATFLESRAFCEAPSEADPVLIEAARRVRENPALLHLAWHCQRLLFDYRDYDASEVRHWPDLAEALGDLSGVFYLLVALSAIPRMRAHDARQGIPEAVTRNGSRRVPETMRSFAERHAGRRGVRPGTLPWLRHHVWGDLYRPGRLEYMARPFRGRLRAFRHRVTGEVIALSEADVVFNAEGYVDSGALAEAPGERWTARLVEDERAVTGSPIAPTGRAIRREVTLSRAEWACVLARTDPVLDIHIPDGGGMTPERCRDSMNQAQRFFPRHFPERPFVAFSCISWIMNPQIAEFYTPTSNMVLLQNEGYLFPCPSNGKAGLGFIFGTEQVDPATAPRDTSLRRAMLDHLAAGKPLRSGGMFVLKEDLVHYGAQHYRRRAPGS
ncbi:MAG: DUF5596 domain-containing protein [Armatimonadetes bacterium]|nr:DUF5596 domain-containing protein [Armatimonadota bacterium]